jgi:hypothetical protein
MKPPKGRYFMFFLFRLDRDDLKLGDLQKHMLKVSGAAG